MFSTFVVVVTFLFLALFAAAVWGAFLWIGLKWARAENFSLKRLAAAAIYSQVLLPVLLAPLALLSVGNESSAIGVSLIHMLLSIVLPCWFVKILFHLRPRRAVRAWLPTLLTMVVVLPFIVFVICPFVIEAFVAPTNSMAPSLLGRHWKGTCDVCGSDTYCSPIDEHYRPYTQEITTICEKFHTTSDRLLDKEPLDGHIHGSDRFLVCKFLKPRRWDIVVFQYPENPSELYVKRLVGLPGEEIYIEDGKVWADGKPLTPPPHLQGIEYASEIPEIMTALSGTKDNRAQLAADEYFVLGDFSLRAKDSRLWEHGAPGHPPYAVPQSHLHGVVTHIYWPLGRARIIR